MENSNQPRATSHGLTANSKTIQEALSPMPEAIIAAVCTALNVTETELKNGKQVRHIADARALLSYFLSEHTDLTQVQIIAIMGLKNHTSVIGHLKKVNDLLGVNRHFAAKKNKIENLINPLCA